MKPSLYQSFKIHWNFIRSKASKSKEWILSIKTDLTCFSCRCRKILEQIVHSTFRSVVAIGRHQFLDISSILQQNTNKTSYNFFSYPFLKRQNKNTFFVWLKSVPHANHHWDGYTTKFREKINIVRCYFIFIVDKYSVVAFNLYATYVINKRQAFLSNENKMKHIYL